LLSVLRRGLCVVGSNGEVSRITAVFLCGANSESLGGFPEIDFRYGISLKKPTFYVLEGVLVVVSSIDPVILNTV